jgi:hypothetical protein
MTLSGRVGPMGHSLNNQLVRLAPAAPQREISWGGRPQSTVQWGCTGAQITG